MFHHFLRRNLSNQSHLLQTPSLLSRFISTISNPNQFTVHYLINSCGLSPQSAVKASQRVVLRSTQNPDSVLSLLRTYGFSETQISKIIANNPTLLLASLERTLKPKLEFFTNMGISGPNLGKLLSMSNTFLSSSLENQIIPSINFLKSLVHSDNSVAFILNRSWWLLHDTECRLGPNIAVLRHHGVPESNISKFLMKNPQDLYIKFDLFNKMVLQLKRIGVSPSCTMFLHGLHVLFAMKKPLWDEKMAAYRSYGWSEDEVLSIFKKQPNIMAASVKKINLSLDFFINSLKWTRDIISKNPTVVLLSLEKRVIPRCYVLQTLLSKDLITKNGMGQALKVAEGAFLEKYVIKHLHELPDLLKAYQSKMDTRGLLVKSEDEF